MTTAADRARRRADPLAACRSCRRRWCAPRSRARRGRATARSCWPTAPSRASSAGTARPARCGRPRSDALDSGKSVLLRVLPDGDDAFPQTPGASIVVNPCLSGGAMEIYLEPLLPSPLAAPRRAPHRPPTRWPTLAPALGFVVDAAARASTRRCDGRGRLHATAATRPAAIRAALDAGVGFVGVVCSHTRGEALLAELDLTPRRRARVHPHVGLDIGARTAPEIGAVDRGRDRARHPGRGTGGRTSRSRGRSGAGSRPSTRCAA